MKNACKSLKQKGVLSMNAESSEGKAQVSIGLDLTKAGI
jgi:hypothetical protein